MKPTIAITLGDVAGIGPEVVRKALRSGKLNSRFQYEVILKKEAPAVKMGGHSAEASRFALKSLETAVDGCLKGAYAAIVTAPVSKSGLKEVGFLHPGQTEWLAWRTGTKEFAMMLVGGALRVSLVTIHEPIRKVSSLLTVEGIARTIRLTYDWLLQFGIRSPRVAVAALNPHGGVREEQGIEEEKYILPAVKKMRRSLGKGITGPHSPDAVFRGALKGSYDAVVCMYHDQGLIPLKMLSFDKGVNLTLGLPLIRTSPDHGTAYDIAGRGIACPESMIEAINLAAILASRNPRKSP
jgi:4-hydroxythreonine-4-phosphate dehydrogenase